MPATPRPEPDDPQTALIFDVVDLVERDLARGERFALAHYLARFPGHEDLVRREYGRLQRRLREGATASAEPAGRRVGPYEIVRELGRGGQGAVYLARDTRLSREVALKMLPPSAFVSQASLQRFRREAEVVASLSHPSICDVIDAEFDGEVAYIAMRFVPGISLAKTVCSDGRPDHRQVRVAIETVRRIANAAHAAHEAGVVHRDIKPDNIIVAPDGEPVLLDFGLAKGVEDVTLTEPGAAFGTLHYMAPEQLDELPTRVDRRADVYALAATLYELVTSRRPFDEAGREALVDLIRTGSAKDPTALNPAVPGDLCIVLDKALEKDPSRRYATARELADDLRRVLADEPVTARPASTMLRIRRWARRHPLLSTSMTLTTLLLTAGVVVSLVLLGRVRAERDRHRALSLAMFAQTLVDENPTLALLTAIEASGIERTQTANTALFSALMASHEERALGFGEVHAGIAVAVSPVSGRFGFTKSNRCSVRRLDGTEQTIDCGATATFTTFDPTGDVLAVCRSDGTTGLFDVGTGALEAEFGSHGRPATSAAFSPDGRFVATAAEDGSSEVFDRRERRLRGTFAVSTSPLELAIVGERTLIALDAAGVLRAFDLLGSTPRWTLGDVGSITELSAGTVAPVLAVATETEVRIVHRDTGRTLQRWSGFEGIRSLGFDRDDHRLAIGFEGGYRIVSAVDGAELVRRRTHARRAVWAVVFSPDGRRLATGGVDGTARVFDARTGAEQFVFPMAVPHVTRVYWTPDGARVIAVGLERAVSVNCLADRAGLAVLRGHEGPVRRVRFCSDGKRILTAGADGTARVFDLDGRPLVRVAHDHPLTEAKWSPNGREVVTITERGVHVFSVGAPERPRLLQAGECVFFEWLDDARLVVVLSSGTVVVRDVVTGALLRELRTGRAVRCAALVDENHAALGHATASLSIVDLAGDSPNVELALESSHPAVPIPAVMNLTAVPDRPLLLAGVEDVHTRLISTEPLRVLGRVPISTPAFTVTDSRGRYVLSGALFNPRSYLMELSPQSIAQVGSRIDHTNRLTHGEFSPDGQRFVTASYDGTARLYDSDTRDGYAWISAHTDVVTHAEFSPDGERLATASMDGTARIWPTDPLPLAKHRAPRALTKSERITLRDHGLVIR